MKKNDQLLGDIVADDFRTASIFSEAGLDFCCGGKKTLETACSEKGISTDEIIEKLSQLEESAPGSGQNFNTWTLDFLCDYIVNTHHSFVKSALPDLIFYTQKIAVVHGENHSELITVKELFSKLNSELVQHLRNEEEVLFPAIKEALKTKSTDSLRTIKSEIARMNNEHEFAGACMDRIHEITGGYEVPADGCNTYHVTFKLLKQFEEDLHIHVHLENNILYRKALIIGK
jgi:regulator of cell morphogenesis and NO signaling